MHAYRGKLCHFQDSNSAKSYRRRAERHANVGRARRRAVLRVHQRSHDEHAGQSARGAIAKEFIALGGGESGERGRDGTNAGAVWIPGGLDNATWRQQRAISNTTMIAGRIRMLLSKNIKHIEAC